MLKRQSFFQILLVTACLMALIYLPTYAQDGGQNSDPVTYFGPAMQPEFQADIAAFPNAPLITLNAAFTVDEQQAVIAGNLSVLYTNQSTDPLTEIVFRLYPNLPTYGGQMTVGNTQVNGAPVVSELDGTSTVLSVPLPQTLAAGEQATVSLDFSSTVFAEQLHLYAQYSYLGGNLALPNFFPVLSVYESGIGWWRNTEHPQGDAVYSETAHFDVTLTAPAGWTMITSGSHLETTENTDQTRTSHYIAPLVRDFALMASPRYETVSGEQDGITIDVHYFSGGEDAAQVVLGVAQRAVRLFNASFGEYPYAELDIVETNTVAGGIEYPGLIVIQSNSWYPDDFYLEIVTAHEVAHQWWYALVGNDQTRYPWLDESLAQYSTALYFGDAYGTAGQQGAFDDYLSSWEGFREGNTDVVIGLSPSDYPGNSYFAIVYSKGPLFFKTLADTYGQEALLNGLKAYFSEYHYEIATPNDLQTILEQSFGEELDVLFLEWVGETN